MSAERNRNFPFIPVPYPLIPSMRPPGSWIITRDQSVSPETRRNLEDTFLLEKVTATLDRLGIPKPTEADKQRLNAELLEIAKEVDARVTKENNSNLESRPPVNPENGEHS